MTNQATKKIYPTRVTITLDLEQRITKTPPHNILAFKEEFPVSDTYLSRPFEIGDYHLSTTDQRLFASGADHICVSKNNGSIYGISYKKNHDAAFVCTETFRKYGFSSPSAIREITYLAK